MCDGIELRRLQHLTAGGETDVTDKHPVDPFARRMCRVDDRVTGRVHNQSQCNIALDAGADRTVVNHIAHDDRARCTRARADTAAAKCIANRRSPVGRLRHTDNAGNVETVSVQVDIGITLQNSPCINLHEVMRFIERACFQAGDRNQRSGKVVNPHFQRMVRQRQISVGACADEHVFRSSHERASLENDPIDRGDIGVGITKRHGRGPEGFRIRLQIDVSGSIHLHLDLAIRPQHSPRTDDDFAQHISAVELGIGPCPRQCAAGDQFHFVPLLEGVEHHSLKCAVNIRYIHNAVGAKAHAGVKTHGGQRISACPRDQTTRLAININPARQPIGGVDVQRSRGNHRIVAQLCRHGRTDGVACRSTRPGQNAISAGVDFRIRVCQMRSCNLECADDIDS